MTRGRHGKDSLPIRSLFVDLKGKTEMERHTESRMSKKLKKEKKRKKKDVKVEQVLLARGVRTELVPFENHSRQGVGLPGVPLPTLGPYHRIPSRFPVGVFAMSCQ